MNAGQFARRFWLLILLGYFAAILLIAATGMLTRLVNERRIAPIVVSAGILGIVAASSLVGSRTPHSTPEHGFLVFLIPLFFFQIGMRYDGPPAAAFAGFDGSLFEAAGVGTESRPVAPQQLGSLPGRRTETHILPREISANPDDPSVREFESIAFGDEFYFYFYSLLYEQRGLLEGKRVIVRGFTGREPSYPPNRFYVARRLLWCCTLDANLLPLLVETDRMSIPRDGAWVEIEAIVTSTAFPTAAGDTTVPLLQAQAIREVEAPEFEYVLAF